MKFKFESKISSGLIVLVLMFWAHFTFAQNTPTVGIFETWSPPDQTLSLDVPVKLKEINGQYPGRDPDGLEKIIVFGEVSANYTFRLTVLHLDDRLTKLASRQKLDGWQFMVGGDDDFEFTERYLMVNGLDTKEIIYGKQNSKGLLVNGGDRIYILALSTKTRDELNSAIANRFFTSFRLLKKKVEVK